MTAAAPSLVALAEELDRASSYELWSYWHGSYGSHIAAWTRAQTARDVFTKAWQAATGEEREAALLDAALLSATGEPGALNILSTLKETP